jgi:hypothetical protein
MLWNSQTNLIQQLYPLMIKIILSLFIVTWPDIAFWMNFKDIFKLNRNLGEDPMVSYTEGSTNSQTNK